MKTISVDTSTADKIRYWSEQFGVSDRVLLRVMLYAMDNVYYRELVRHLAEIEKTAKAADEAMLRGDIELHDAMIERLGQLADKSAELVP